VIDHASGLRPEKVTRRKLRIAKAEFPPLQLPSCDRDFLAGQGIVHCKVTAPALRLTT